jgi:hypothetical protein
MNPTPDQIEERRLRKVLASEQVSAFEREDAERALAKLQERRDPTYAHCEQRSSTHGRAVCPVVATFERSHGKGLIPTATQAADVRRRIREKEEAARAAELFRAVKAGQRSPF